MTPYYKVKNAEKSGSPALAYALGQFIEILLFYTILVL